MFVNVNYHNILKKLSKNLFNGLKWGFSNSAYRKGVAKVLLSTINYKTPPPIHVMSSLTQNPLSEIPNQTIFAPFSLFSGNGV